MTAAEIDRQEKDAFLDWRRGLATYVPLSRVFNPRSQISVTAFRKQKTSSLRHLNGIWRYGGSYGVYLNGHISWYKSSMLEIHSDSDARIWRTMWMMWKVLKARVEQVVACERRSYWSTRQIY